MTPEQIALVKSTWKQVVPIADKAADLFYDRLFAISPRLRPLFPDDMAEQKKKLLAMLGRAVASLNQVDALVPALQDLGKLHASRGVKDLYYGTVGRALLWTLEQGLGSAWTPEAKEAWTEVYALVSSTMQEAAKKAA